MNPKPKPAKKVKTKKRYMKRGKKTARQVLEEQLDRTVRDIVLLRDGCCVCPAPEKGHSSIRQPGHLISRGKVAVRWSLLNVAEQCSACNLRHTHQFQYYNSWFVQKFGMDTWLQLNQDSTEVTKYSIEDLEEMLGQLRLIYSYQLEDKSFKPRFTQKQILSGEWRALRGLEIMTTYRLDNFTNVEAA